MLRFLIILLGFEMGSASAQIPRYKDPSKDKIESQKAISQKAVKQADDLLQQRSTIPSFMEPSLSELNLQKRVTENVFAESETNLKNGQVNEVLTEERKKLKDLGIGTFSFTLPEFLKMDHLHRYLNDSISASSKIQESQNRERDENILIFVSLSMPETELKSLLLEAQRANAAIVLRGVFGDWTKTLKKVKDIAGENGGILIDPNLFRRFQIQSVPSFVLPKESLERCTGTICPAIKYVTAKGSVSLRYFLEQVERTGDFEEKEIAKFHLSKL